MARDWLKKQYALGQLRQAGGDARELLEAIERMREEMGKKKGDEMDLDKLIPTYTDLSDWNIQVYQNTTGSRIKRIAINIKTGEEYFLKGSKVLGDGSAKFPSEFWSEIVSSKIGQYLGFNMLDYNIGFEPKFFQKVGCLSKSMVADNESRLTEGKNYLVGFKPSYNPIKDKKEYTFQFIRETLEHFKLGDKISSLIEIIVFDAIVSNSDRHQENWGIIFSLEKLNNELDIATGSNATNLLDKSTLDFQSAFEYSSFSPIYDSGCCLGREIENHKLKEYLNDKVRLEAYTNKGFSEIHWKGEPKKKRHFELLELLKPDYNKNIEGHINRVKNHYKKEDIETIIYAIDENLPKNLSQYSLSKERKELMVKIIHLRVHKLFSLLS